MKTNSISFIGGGRITRIILEAFKNQNVNFEKIVVFDPNEETLQKLKSKFPQIHTEAQNLAAVTDAEVLFVSLHPPVIMETLEKLKASAGKISLIVSLAPKITIEKMSTALGGYNQLARVNPSATGIINQGINPVAFSKDINEEYKTELLSILNVLGEAPIVEEAKIEAYALISAMGSTYLWFQLQKLQELGVKFGMNEAEASQVVSDMVKATADTLFNSGLQPEDVTNLVPVKPLGEYEEIIKGYYEEKLTGIFEKIKP